MAIIGHYISISDVAAWRFFLQKKATPTLYITHNQVLFSMVLHMDL